MCGRRTLVQKLPVESVDVSPDAVPRKDGLSRAIDAVFPDVHTSYDYDEGFF